MLATLAITGSLVYSGHYAVMDRKNQMNNFDPVLNGIQKSNHGIFHERALQENALRKDLGLCRGEKHQSHQRMNSYMTYVVDDFKLDAHKI